MLSIGKQDIIKTVLIIWFIAATGYVVYDIYIGYKVRGMQAAYQQGYTDAVNQVIDQTQKGGCQTTDIHSGDKKVSIVAAQCAQSPQAAQQGAIQSPAIQK
jgi:hypothetical protein